MVVKPNDGSQGTNVAFVYNKKEFYLAMNRVFKKARVALVQKPVYGNDYRVVVLDSKIISVYQRIPLSVVGDGQNSILSLLSKKQAQFLRDKRDTQIDVNDPRIKNKLCRFGLSLQSVLEKGCKVYLLDNANLSTGKMGSATISHHMSMIQYN